MDNIISDYDKNASKRPNTFLGDIAKTLNAKKHGSGRVEYSRENKLFHPKELELVKLGRQANQSELQKVLLSTVIRMRAHQALKVNQ